MRPIEALLVAANFCALLAVMVPSQRARWLLYFALLPLPIAVAQTLYEGYRWQLAPAYLLALMLIAMASRAMPATQPDERTRFWRRSVAVLGALLFAISALLPGILPVFRFPPPDGPYPIGTMTYHWVDMSRREIFSADPHALRELMVQIWYPAAPTASKARAPYVQDPSVLKPLARLLHLPDSIFGYLRYVRTNALAGAPVANDKSNYPVLIFSHGRGGFRQENTFQVEALVSHGYVVAAIDHTYAASGVLFPDGRRVMFDSRMLDRKFHDSMIPYFAQDAIFVLQQLANLNASDPAGVLSSRLDVKRAGIFGLSMGGEVSAEACRLEPLFGACLVMDVWMPVDIARHGLPQPSMFITRDTATMRREGWRQTDIDETFNTMRAAYQASSGERYWLLIPGMYHQNPSDFPLAIPAPLGRWIGLIGPIDARRCYEILNAYTLAFFERHLKSQSEALLAGPAQQYPEVTFETRAP
jgi:predicted dienelactone hydrolase